MKRLFVGAAAFMATFLENIVSLKGVMRVLALLLVLYGAFWSITSLVGRNMYEWGLTLDAKRVIVRSTSEACSNIDNWVFTKQVCNRVNVLDRYGKEYILYNEDVDAHELVKTFTKVDTNDHHAAFKDAASLFQNTHVAEITQLRGVMSNNNSTPEQIDAADARYAEIFKETALVVVTVGYRLPLYSVAPNTITFPVKNDSTTYFTYTAIVWGIKLAMLGTLLGLGYLLIHRMGKMTGKIAIALWVVHLLPLMLAFAAYITILFFVAYPLVFALIVLVPLLAIGWWVWRKGKDGLNEFRSATQPSAPAIEGTATSGPQRKPQLFFDPDGK